MNKAEEDALHRRIEDVMSSGGPHVQYYQHMPGGDTKIVGIASLPAPDLEEVARLPFPEACNFFGIATSFGCVCYLVGGKVVSLEEAEGGAVPPEVLKYLHEMGGFALHQYPGHKDWWALRREEPRYLHIPLGPDGQPDFKHVYGGD